MACDVVVVRTERSSNSSNMTPNETERRFPQNSSATLRLALNKIFNYKKVSMKASLVNSIYESKLRDTLLTALL